MYDAILLRYGETGLKSNKTRPYFEKKYINAIKEALKKNYIEGVSINNRGGRFVLYCEDVEEAIPVLQRVPGIQSLSPAKKITFSSKKYLINQVQKLSEERVKDKIFCVRVNRIGIHEFSSPELEREIGSALYENSKGVDLTDPEVTVNVEIRDDDAFVFKESYDGLGGLPPGTGGKVLCLFSGGIDSPVAALQMLKRGCEVDFLFVNLMTDKLKNEVAKIYNFLIENYCFNYKPKIYVLDGKPLTKKIKAEVPDRLRQLAFKIGLYRIGKFAMQDQICLVTGEALAQKSSQTLESLLFINKHGNVPVVRPIFGLDKIEIIKIARAIRTMGMSEKVKEFCNLSEGSVVTNPKEEHIEKIPSFDLLIKKLVEESHVYKGFMPMNDSESDEQSLPAKSEKSKIISVDIRAKNVRENIPLTTNKQISYHELIDKLDDFEKGKSYLFVCEFGVRSEDVAFTLRKKGVNAAGINMQNYKNYFEKTKK